MLSKDVIQAIRSLLARVELRGQEVPAFNMILQALHEEEQASEAGRAQSLQGASNAPVVLPEKAA